ncbi:uncharacterized protein LOC110687531 [Chenopodium quinoa]|uniref:uncharacterized protein LOC110687531 n=1 Tax=Chenopodium quinoa TaxID=63459 RepID=UPI000B77DE2D|nr:uncharacterized protein LOC110687531 [Chenopodium quinoa]
MLNDGHIDFGGIIKDYEGDIMAATVLRVRGGKKVVISKALAAKHALQIAIEAGLAKIVLETDNIKVYRHMKNNIHKNTSFGFIIKDILELAKNFIDVVFSRVSRNGNKVAYCLANLSKNYDSLRVWIKEAPIEAMNFVLVETRLLI